MLIMLAMAMANGYADDDQLNKHEKKDFRHILDKADCQQKLMLSRTMISDGF